MNNILEKTIKEMPDVFTSNYFSDRAVDNGYPRKLLKNKIAAFLRRHSFNEYPQSKTWHKIDKVSKPVEVIGEAEMITYLKTKGYKIMKPITQYEEL
tara:strand:- start:767 stop:1057 length:291 start_codon:yes stop_codon:yes gene_type:complete